MTTPTDMIKELRAEIDKLQRIIDNCPHPKFSVPVYDPLEQKIPCDFRIDREHSHGSDPEYRATGTRIEVTKRWSKHCLVCGKVITTLIEKVTATVPDFGG